MIFINTKSFRTLVHVNEWINDILEEISSLWPILIIMNLIFLFIVIDSQCCWLIYSFLWCVCFICIHNLYEKLINFFQFDCIHWLQLVSGFFFLVFFGKFIHTHTHTQVHEILVVVQRKKTGILLKEKSIQKSAGKKIKI